ncbi:hypothetical protein JW872_02730 [Candidatus Babeliales bacterium]|nr:hypothetical protein [Candidatus Babeliales bacterium]
MNISSKIKQIFFVALSLLYLNSTIEAQQGPNPNLQQFAANMPMPTEEEIQAASAFLEDFFNNMSDEEMADFMQFYEGFVQDIESGKIKVEDIFGPLPEQPPVTPQEPKKPEPQNLPEQKPAPVTQDNLRDKKATAEIIKKLIASITSLKTKAASSHKVLTTIEPLSKEIDTLVYYLYALEKPEHIQQLVTDKELIPLHDQLKSLQQVMEQYEPRLAIPEFGIGPQNPQEKEASKKALSEIINAFKKAFSAENILEKLEKLFEKYEPEILKQKKAAEDAEERAKQELAAMKGWRQDPSRVAPEPRERNYPTRYSDRGSYGGGYQDYSVPSVGSGSIQPPRQFSGAPSSLPPAPKTSTPTVVGSQTHQLPAPPETKPSAKKSEPEKTKIETPAEDHLITNKLTDLKEALGDASKAATEVNKTTKNDLPMYLITNSTTADEKQAKEINKKLETCIESLTDAKKYKKSVESRIESAKRSDYTSKVNETMMRVQPSLKHLYDSLYNALDNYTPTVQARHMGYEIKGVKKLTDRNLIESFQELYEDLYNPPQKAQRKEKSKKVAAPEPVKTMEEMS